MSMNTMERDIIIQTTNLSILMQSANAVQQVYRSITDGKWADEEFRMYRYHQRLIDGKPSFGWQRNMIHSLTQQITRGDLGYWLAYVALRPDGNPPLRLDSRDNG